MLCLNMMDGDDMYIETSDGIIRIIVDKTGKTKTRLLIDAPPNVTIERGNACNATLNQRFIEQQEGKLRSVQ